MTDVTEEKTELKNYFSKILERYECINNVNVYKDFKETFDIVFTSKKDVLD